VSAVALELAGFGSCAESARGYPAASADRVAALADLRKSRRVKELDQAMDAIY
jgi:hypothetical protein